MGPHLIPPRYRKLRPRNAPASWGNCYPAAEALYHLWGRRRGWQPAYIRYEIKGTPATHWLLTREGGATLDPTADQFTSRTRPDCTQVVGCGFLTKRPSKRARQLMRGSHAKV
jgi:hypothetical protein